MKFTYLYQPPKKYTFEQEALREWCASRCEGRILNLFAGKIVVVPGELRVDMDPEMPADFHGDAVDFLKTWRGEPFGTVIFDPPYNARKAREKYGGRWVGCATAIKYEIPKVLALRGLVISFGFSSVGMGRQAGFSKEEICLVCHNGDHNDTICVVERRIVDQKELGLDEVR